MSPVKEKRRHQRTDRKFVLRVADSNTQSKEWTLVTSKNLSAGGVMFTYDKELKEGTPLDFTIYFPDHAVDCKGQVYRTSSADLQPLVSVAASIEGLPEKDREFLARNVD